MGDWAEDIARAMSGITSRRSALRWMGGASAAVMLTALVPAEAFAKSKEKKVKKNKKALLNGGDTTGSIETTVTPDTSLTVDTIDDADTTGTKDTVNSADLTATAEETNTDGTTFTGQPDDTKTLDTKDTDDDKDTKTHS